MFSNWWDKIKNWVLAGIEKLLLREIDKLDRYEVELAELVKEHVDPDHRSKQVVDFVQVKLTELVVKTFDSKWLSRSFFQHIEDELLEEIDGLDRYEDELATLVKTHLNPDERAKLIVDYVQDYLKDLVKKYIEKI